MIWKILIWNNAIDFFILSRIQNQSPCTDFSKMKTLHTTCFKTAWEISWFYTNDISVHSSDAKFTHQIPTLFSIELVVSGSHPDILVCRWDPLDPPKSDPDCPGHLTHFWSGPVDFLTSKDDELVKTVEQLILANINWSLACPPLERVNRNDDTSLKSHHTTSHK